MHARLFDSSCVASVGVYQKCVYCYYRVKSLFGAKPHTKADAIKASGMGAPDNGKKAVSEPVAYEYDTEAVGTGVRGLDL